MSDRAAFPLTTRITSSEKLFSAVISFRYRHCTTSYCSGPAPLPEHMPVGLPAYLWFVSSRYCTTTTINILVVALNSTSMTCWILRTKCSGVAVLWVFGIVPFRYYTNGMITFLGYCTTDSGSFQSFQAFTFRGVPLWSYHWAFDGWRIYCDGSSTFSVCVSSELLKDGREGRTPMAWHFPVW